MDPVLAGLDAIMVWQNVLAMIAALFAGIVAGAIPGLSATMAVALLLPLTYGLNPLFALALMAGIHNGAAYGGSIPAILLRVPGTPAAVATTFDGYPMAQNGLVSQALRISVVSSALGGVISAIALMTLAPPLATMALAFGPPEIFWLSVLGLVSTAVLIGRDPIKGLLGACIGIMLGLIGMDHVTGYPRLTFGILELTGGLALPVVLIALFGVPVAVQMGERRASARAAAAPARAEHDRMRQWPWRTILPAWLRGSLYGVGIGILPGLGGAVSGLLAYGSQKRAAKVPDAYGKGHPAGVAVAECANNADNAASLIPALTLAIPGSGVAAVVLAGLLIHGLQPGPQLFADNPQIVYGYMWAMLLTSVMLIAVGGGLAINVFARVLYFPPVLLMPIILCLTVIGAYTYESSMFNVYVLCLLGLLGYALDRLDFPIPPVILAFILGPKVEFNLRISLSLSRGDWSIFWTRPIAIALMLAVVFVLVAPWAKPYLRWRRAPLR